jgi:hypothetical protein
VIRRRWAIAGLTLLASLTLATTACQTKSGGGGGTPTTAAKSATEILTDAANKTKGQSFKFTLAYGTIMTGDGVQDGSGANANINMTLAEPTSGLNIKIGALVIGSDMYMKMDFGALGAAIPGLAEVGDKWMHIDSTKAGAGLNLGIKAGEDTIGAESYIKGVVSAEKVSDTEIKGTMDLTKSAPVGTDDEDIKALGDAAKSVPFTATLDSQGRMSKIVIKMPKVGDFPASDMTTTYTDYGAAVDLKKPAASEVVEAPAMIYQFLQ